MPSTRTYHSISRSLNNASLAMPSLARASRIPTPQCASVARIPIATARSIPRPVNSLSVARKYIPTVQRARPSTTVASMASSFAAMSISKPANQAIASPSAPKPTSSLPGVAVPCSKLASDRIQARRQRIVANLQASRKRPTAPASIPKSSSMPSRAVPPAVTTPASIPQSSSMPSRAVPPAVTTPASIPQSSSMPSRAVPLAVITPVSILKSSSKPSRVIPAPPVNALASTLTSSWMPSRSRKPRGTKPYCEGRPGCLDEDGNRPQADYQPLFYFGIRCKCHPTEGDIPAQHKIGPRLWKTTPAEADVDPKRPRIVRFADNLVQSTRTFRPWYNKTWPSPEQSSDDTTEAEDDAAISAMDTPPAVEVNTNLLPGSSDFQSTWQTLMDEGFPDDDEHFS